MSDNRAITHRLRVWACLALAYAIAASSGSVPAASQTPPVGTAPTDSELLTPVRFIAQYRPDYAKTVIDHRLLFPQFDSTGGTKEIISLDPETGDGTVVASGLIEPVRILFIDARAVIVLDGSEVVVFDTATGKARYRLKPAHVPKAAVVIGRELLLAGGSPLSLDRYDLSTHAAIFSREGDNALQEPVFWKDKLVGVASGEVTLYDDHLDKIAAAPAPKNEPYGYGNCGIVDPRVYESRLVYQVSCGRLVVFDLERFATRYELARFDPSRFVAFDVAGNNLFAVPTEPDRKPDNGAVFDLASGRRIAVLSIDADGIAVRGTAMAAYLPEVSYYQRPIGLYSLDFFALSDAAQRNRITEAYASALRVLANSSSVEGAIDALESAPTEPLLADGHLDAQARAMALDYGAWLAGTFDRHDKGIALLERLATAAPDDPVARRRLGAALFRDYLLTDSPASLERARTLLSGIVTPDSALAQLVPIPSPAARSTAIDFSDFAGEIVFWRDKIVIGRRDEAPSLALLDRATLQPWATIEIRPADEIHEDSIAGITFDGDQILAWMNYEDAEPGRANLAIIDPRSRWVTLRFLRGGGFDGVLVTRKGIVTCASFAERCTFRNAKSFRPTSASFNCVLMALVGDDSIDQDGLADLVASGCDAVWGNMPVAISKEWIVTGIGVWPGPYAIAYRRLNGGGSSQSTDLELAPSNRVLIPDGRDYAIVANKQGETVRFSHLDFAGGTHRTLLQIAVPPHGGVIWTAADRLLLIGAGHDLIVYDLESEQIAGILRRVVPQGFLDNGHGLDRAEIDRLLVDGPHVIALTVDGQYSRLLDLPDLLRIAAQKRPYFTAVDRLLRQ